MRKPYCFFVFLLVLLTGCHSLRERPAESRIATGHPDWLVLENGSYCYPFDEKSAQPVSGFFPALTLEQGSAEDPVSLYQDGADAFCPHIGLWTRLQSGFSFDYIDDPAVQAQLNWYVSHPDYMERVQVRANRYMHYIVNQLDENGLPYDIALLPIVESAYEPFAYSQGRASGLWQFIPGTGKRFGLQQDWWFDGRRDAVQSTDAAIKYLKYLRDYFEGDWLLAIAAYNSGEGTVRNAIKKNRELGKPIDFWNLDLPAETRAYVPKMIALVEIFRNPEKYSINLVPISDRPYFGEVELDSQLDLSQAAELAGISMEEIYYLNPGLNRWATPPQSSYTLKLPEYTIEEFKTALAALDKDSRMTWQRHTIKKGESLNGIARQYRSDKQQIKEINKLLSDRIVAGQTLMIPVASANPAAYTHSESARLDLRQNTQPSGKAEKIEYHVQSGDTFWRIATNHGVDTQSLAKWNNKSTRDTLKVGEKLVIWTNNPSAKGSLSRPEKITRVNYKVKKGDSLTKVASRFKVGTREIIAWNSINPKKHLRPGQALTLYINVMDTY